MSKTTGLIPRIKVVNAVDGQLLCLCDDCGGILSIHLNNFEAEYVGKLEGEDFFQIALSCGSAVYKKNILYSPYYSKNIHVFNWDKREDRIITNFPAADEGSNKYAGLLQDGSRCYIVPYVGQNIWEIDMDKLQVVRKIDIYNILKKKGIAVDHNNFSESEVYRYGNKFYISMENIPVIVELDVRNDIYEAFELEGLSEGLCGIAGIDNILYILSKENYIIAYNIDEKKVLNKVKIRDGNDSFFYITLISGNDIYFVQRGLSAAVRYNSATCNAEYINFNEELSNAPDGEDYKFVGALDKNRILLISGLLNVAVLNLENKKCEYGQIKYNIDELKNAMVQDADFQSINKEYSRLALPYYIQHKKSTVVNQMDSRVGPQIYETINFLV